MKRTGNKLLKVIITTMKLSNKCHEITSLENIFLMSKAMEQYKTLYKSLFEWWEVLPE